MVNVDRRSFVLAAVAALCLGGCSAEPSQDGQQEPVSYVGDWTEKDAGTDGWQEATVTDGRIEVYWMTPDSKALYWAGTFDAQGDGAKVSENDREATSKALLASGADTKEFECADGEIAYEVTAMGVTVTRHLVRK